MAFVSYRLVLNRALCTWFEFFQARIFLRVFSVCLLIPSHDKDTMSGFLTFSDAKMN